MSVDAKPNPVCRAARCLCDTAYETLHAELTSPCPFVYTSVTLHRTGRGKWEGNACATRKIVVECVIVDGEPNASVIVSIDMTMGPQGFDCDPLLIQGSLLAASGCGCTDPVLWEIVYEITE